MKKCRSLLVVLIIVITNFSSLICGVYSVYANERTTDGQQIIDQENLKVVVKPILMEKGIQWEVNYTQKSPDKKESYQRLKFRLRSKGKLMNVQVQEKWQVLEDNWYGESTFFKENEGVFRFITDMTIKDLEIEIQKDYSESADSKIENIIQNTLDDKYQGPFKLELPKLSTFAEEKQLNKFDFIKNNKNLVAENKGIPDSQTVYKDPFNYTHLAGNTFPENYTSNYLNRVTGVMDSSNEVRNFDYGKTYTATPNTVNSLNGQLNFINGYHTYANPYNLSDKDSTILTKKSVSPTTNPNQFNVQLDVIGSASKVEKPIDVVFVIDKSSSMGQNVDGEILNDGPKDKNSKWQILKEAFKTFSAGLTASTKDIQMGLVGFGTNYYKNEGTKEIWADGAKFGNSLSTNDYNELITNSIFTNDPDKGSKTPTYLGVDLGAKILKEIGRPNSDKYLIVLTDGEPTFYPMKDNEGAMIGINKAVETSYDDKIRYELNKSDFNGDGTKVDFQYTDEYIQNTVYTNDFMKNVKKYGIGYGVSTSELVDNETVKHVLEAIADDPNRVLDASSDTELQVVLEEIERYISGYKNNFQYGILSDYMSPYVHLIGDASSVTVSALNIKKESSNNITVIKDGTKDFPGYAKKIKKYLSVLQEGTETEIRLSQMTLGGLNGNREGIRLNYIVELKPAFQDGKFYPTNGPTWTKSTNHQTYLGFAVPSVRNEAFLNILVQKVWEGDESYPDLRKEATFQLQQSIGNSPSWSDVSGKTLTIPANATGDTLKGSFEKLPTVSITKDATGNLVYQPMNYRVIETARVPGYLQGVVTPTTAINSQTVNRAVTITNQLMTTDLSFTKVKEDGSNLAGAEFTLYRKNGSNSDEFQRINNPKDSQFTFKKVPIGSYVLKETISPKGFQQKEDIEFTVEDRSSGTPTIRATKGTLDDDPSQAGNQLMNQLLPFTLAVTKQDGQTKKKLSGVTFTLSEKDQSGSLSTLTTNSDGTGIVVDDKNQAIPLVTGKTYLLKETKGKPEYVNSPLTFELSVKADGTITVLANGTPYQEVRVTNQVIQLTVNNYQKGFLPSTGGSGKTLYYRLTLAVVSLLVVIGVIYLYRNRKGMHK